MDNFNGLIEEYYKKYGVMIDIMPDFVAVKNRLKKALSFTIEPHKDFGKCYPSIEDLCARAGLRVEHYPSKLDRRNHNILISERKLYIIDDDKDENEDNRFSYPDCCVKAFNNKKKHLSYFNDDIRELLTKEDTFDFRLNPFTINYPFHLISHLPCSLHCKKTLEYSSKLLNIIKKQNKSWYSHIMYFNKTYVLYLDMCGIYILLKGKLSVGKIMYEDFYPRCLYEKKIGKSVHYSSERYKMFQEILKTLLKGNTIRLKENKLTILKDGKIMRVFKKPKHLFWKIVRFV
jgi:hypothetical protein